jgi:hypothetical protein
MQKSSVFCDSALRSDCIAGFGLLTGSRVRDITTPLWRPASTGHEHGAKPSENTANLALSAHVQGVDSQAFDFPDNFSGIFALALKFALKYQYVADSP